MAHFYISEMPLISQIITQLRVYKKKSLQNTQTQLFGATLKVW